MSSQPLGCDGYRPTVSSQSKLESTNSSSSVCGISSHGLTRRPQWWCCYWNIIDVFLHWCRNVWSLRKHMSLDECNAPCIQYRRLNLLSATSTVLANRARNRPGGWCVFSRLPLYQHALFAKLDKLLQLQVSEPSQLVMISCVSIPAASEASVSWLPTRSTVLFVSSINLQMFAVLAKKEIATQRLHRVWILTLYRLKSITDFRLKGGNPGCTSKSCSKQRRAI